MMPFSYAMGIGFKNLSAASPFVKLNAIIPSLVETTLGWFKYQKAATDAPILRQIVMARTTILHDLLSVPDICPSVRSPDECLYALCRLGCLSYMLIFLYPLSQGNGPHEQLARRLMVMLDIASSLELWTTHANLMLWVTIIGGMVAKGTPLRHWYIEELNNSGIKHALVAWPLVSSVLKNYLWLDIECEAEGMALWRASRELTQSRAASF
jgi:hypothetical protein